MATKPEFLASKKDMSCIGGRIGHNFEPWVGYYNTIPVLSLRPCKSKGPAKLALFTFLWGPSLIATRYSCNGAVWRKHCQMRGEFIAYYF